MENYYAKSLNAARLFQVYQSNIPEVRRYLDAEIAYVRRGLAPDDIILEVGAGYGRVMKELAQNVRFVHGIDISEDSVAFGLEYLRKFPNCKLDVADIYNLAAGMEYDAVLCIQNGLSAITGNNVELVRIILKILKKGGKAYFSSYSPKFWETRLAWFEEQASKGLLGSIDYEKTAGGKIVCNDGFMSETYAVTELERLGKASGCNYVIHEEDDSSVFLVIQK